MATTRKDDPQPPSTDSAPGTVLLGTTAAQMADATMRRIVEFNADKMVAVPERFSSNDAYLRFELFHLRHRVVSYGKLLQNPDHLGAYLQTCEYQDAQRVAVREARRRSIEAGVDIPLHRIVEDHGLTVLEEQALLTCLVPVLSEPLRETIIAVQGNGFARPQMEVGFVAELLNPSLPRGQVTDTSWCEPGSPLLEQGLVTLEIPTERAVRSGILNHAVRTPHYVAMAVRGRTVVDERLHGFCELETPTRELFDLVLDDETTGQVDTFIRAFQRPGEAPQLGHANWILLVSGPRQTGKTELARAIAHTFGRPIFTLNIHQFPRAQDRHRVLRLAVDNARFFGAVLHVVQPEFAGRDSHIFGPLLKTIEEFPGLVILEPAELEFLDSAYEAIIHHGIQLHRPAAEQREMLWESLMPADIELDDTVDIPRLANTFELTGGQIRRAIEWARQRAHGRAEPVSTQDLEAGARSQLRSKIDKFADRSKSRMTLDNLILRPETRAQVMSLLHACKVRQRVLNEWGFARRLTYGKGLVALLTGEPGTGKTLTAEILANELDLKLHVVNMPDIVSKWVGETEKNIREIFTQARANDSMLLFDEADAMFTKRVKVERAQDHFQNMEVNMLLQEIERFDGIVLLTTNLEVNMDRAFQRRILYKVEFPLPDPEERAAIWRVLLPPQTPLEEEIDFDELADVFELSGGQIKNAVIRAAYDCYAAGHGITQQALANAAQDETTAAGHLARYPHKQTIAPDGTPRYVPNPEGIPGAKR